MYKKIIFGSLGFIFILLLLALILPFLIDMNQFKPQIQAVVSESVEAEIEFDSARLTILPGLGVRLKNVSVKNTDPVFNGEELFRVDDFDFRVSLFPVFRGLFDGYILIESPAINIINKGIQNNIASLKKPSEKSEDQDDSKKEEKTPKDKESMDKKVEDFKEKITIRSLKILNASFKLSKLNTDNTKEEPIKVSNLNIIIENIGLGKNIKTNISTDVEVKQPGIVIQGPINLNLLTNIKTEGTKFQIATYEGNLNLNNLYINAKNAFVKNKGIALDTTFKGEVTETSFLLSELLFRLHSLNLKAKAQISDFKKLVTDVNVSMVNNDLKSLGEVLPQHEKLLIAGKLKLLASVKGTMSDLNRLSAKLDLETNLTGSDLNLKVDAPKLEGPKVSVIAKSNRLDLGALLEPFLKEPKKEKDNTEEKKAPPKKTETSKDFELTKDQKALLSKTDALLDISLKEIIYKKYIINNFDLKAKQKDLIAFLQHLKLDLFEGNILAKGKVDLKASPIQFVGNLEMNHIQTRSLLETISEEHKKILEGHANFDLNLRGSGTTLPTLSKTLNGQGRYQFLDGKLHSGSIADKLANQIDNFLGSLSVSKAAGGIFKSVEEKLKNPIFQKATDKLDISKKKAKYDSVSKVQITDKMKIDKSLKDVKGKITIKDGRIHLLSSRKTEDGTLGMQLSVGLDMSLGGDGTYMASNEMKKYMLKQNEYSSLIFDRNNNLTFDFNLTGNISQPKVNIDFAPIRKNFQNNAQTLVKEEIQSKIKNDTEKLGVDKIKTKTSDKIEEGKTKAQEKVKEKTKDTVEDAKEKFKEKFKF